MIATGGDAWVWGSSVCGAWAEAATGKQHARTARKRRMGVCGRVWVGDDFGARRRAARRMTVGAARFQRPRRPTRPAGRRRASASSADRQLTR